MWLSTDSLVGYPVLFYAFWQPFTAPYEHQVDAFLVMEIENVTVFINTWLHVYMTYSRWPQWDPSLHRWGQAIHELWYKICIVPLEQKSSSVIREPYLPQKTHLMFANTNLVRNHEFNIYLLVYSFLVAIQSLDPEQLLCCKACSDWLARNLF